MVRRDRLNCRLIDVVMEKHNGPRRSRERAAAHGLRPNLAGPARAGLHQHACLDGKAFISSAGDHRTVSATASNALSRAIAHLSGDERRSCVVDKPVKVVLWPPGTRRRMPGRRHEHPPCSRSTSAAGLTSTLDEPCTAGGRSAWSPGRPPASTSPRPRASAQHQIIALRHGNHGNESRPPEGPRPAPPCAHSLGRAARRPGPARHRVNTAFTPGKGTAARAKPRPSTGRSPALVTIPRRLPSARPRQEPQRQHVVYIGRYTPAQTEHRQTPRRRPGLPPSGPRKQERGPTNASKGAINCSCTDWVPPMPARHSIRAQDTAPIAADDGRLHPHRRPGGFQYGAIGTAISPVEMELRADQPGQRKCRCLASTRPALRLRRAR